MMSATAEPPMKLAGLNPSATKHDRWWLRVVTGAVFGALLADPAAGQHISVDGSLSAARTLTGPNYSITPDLGKQVGGNLFHSFGNFGLARGESANFTGPSNVNNIVGRVTGGSASSIDGAIRSSITGANLYLINPAGMVFGPNATVSVSGAFHASTADYVRLSDGARFQATNPSGSTLSAAAPAAFGFLNASPPALTVNGSRIEVNPRQTLGFVGGPVSVTGTARLTAPGGTIHVSSAASTGEVPVDPTNANGFTAATLGAVSIAGVSTLDVSDFRNKGNGGSIFVNADRLTIADGGFLEGSNYGTGRAGQISLRGDSQITLSNGARVHSVALGSGRGGDIALKTGPRGSIAGSGSGTLVDIGTSTGAPGGSGQLTVTTGALTLTGGAIFGSEMKGSGSAGPISISAESILLDGRTSGKTAALTGIRSNTLGGTANAADIAVNAGTLTILANGEIVTNTAGSGNAGRISVAVTGALGIDAAGAQFSTGIGTIASPGSTGNAGDMTLSAGSLSIAGSGGLLSPSPAAPSSNPFAGLSAQTFSSGIGGSITLNVGAGPLGLTNGAVISSSTSSSGQGGALNVTAQGPLVMSDKGTAITAAALAGASGNAGSVTVSAPQVTLNSGAQIASTTAGTGAGGTVSVTTPGALLVDGAGVPGTQIAASATAPQSGAAGSVSVQAGSLTLLNGGQIAGTTAGRGGGGDVEVTVAGDVNLSGKASEGSASGITASATAGSVGAAGRVRLAAGGALSLSGGAQIASSTAGAGDGGTVTVTAAGALSLSDGGTGIVTLANANASGDAGAVTVNAPQITMTSGAQIASTTQGTGAGGSVAVTTPGALLLDGGGAMPTQIAASATGLQSGPGGAVAVSAGSITIRGGAQIASSTAGPGTGGIVAVSAAGDITLSGPGPQITARSTGSGDAGSVMVSALNLSMADGAAISTEAAIANGGNIEITVPYFIHLVDSQITTSVKGSFGNGGNITIDPQLIVLERSQIIAHAVLGHGGDIRITVGDFLPSADSLVSASSSLGISGTVEITGPRVDLNGSLVVLSSELRQAVKIMRNSCAVRSALPRSSLTQRGRGGLLQDTETTVPALYFADRAPEPARPGGPTRAAARATHVSSLRLTMHCK